MIEYPSGAAVLGEARLRLQGLSVQAGILIVEGRDDLRLFSRICPTLAQVIPAGGKSKVLDAERRSKRIDTERMLFVVDCDYDVPAKLLSGAPHLVITEHAAAETDLIALGGLRGVVLELVRGAADTEEKLDQTTEEIVKRAVALAEAHGRIRYVSRVNGLNLEFDPSRLKRYRSAGTADVDAERLARTVAQNSSYPDSNDLHKKAQLAPDGIKVCHGHDLVECIRVVLRQDFDVDAAKLTSLDELLRSNSIEHLANWVVVQRIRAWEKATGRMILSPP